MENRKALLPQVKAKAERFKIDWKVLDGIICVESSYDPWAIKYEKKTSFFQFPEKFSKLNRVDIDTEVQLQKFSLGLGQLMGYNARAMGFNGPLMKLCEADTNLLYVCRHIESLMRTYRFQEDIISVYNFGHIAKRSDGKYVNQETYVDKVLKFMESAK